MRRSEYRPLDFSLASPPPGTAAKFRRWNVVLIAILAFLVLGVFVVAEAPSTGNSPSNAAVNQSAKPTAAQHANSIKSTQPDVPDPGRSGSFDKLKKSVESGHHG